MIYLIIKDKEEKIDILRTQVVRCLTIGRGEDVDISLEDKSISRLHAVVIPSTDGRLHLRDLGSSTGTYTYALGEEKRLYSSCEDSGKALLVDGEKFRVGNYLVEVEYEEVLGDMTIPEDFIKEEVTESYDPDEEEGLDES